MTVEIRSRYHEYGVEFCPASELNGRIGHHAILITDENLARCYPDFVRGFDESIIIPSGEASKCVAVWERALSELADLGTKRTSTLAAFGGGVVGDLGGFVAASYMRGIPWIMIPTSLLAMVDSSIGGKVGIDLPQGKNLVGAFHPPQRVLIASELLQSLPERHFWNGTAEILKTAFILDAELVGLLESEPLKPNDPRLQAILLSCIRHKARVVEADELEANGLRAILNFGHTVGHSIEKELHYETLLHGEAVAIGMMAETLLGERLGITPEGTSDRLNRVLERHQLPVAGLQTVSSESLIATMRLDKKANHAGIAMSLLTGVGTCKLVQNVSESEILRTLHEIGFD